MAFGKVDLFSKKIPPKCSYCEYGNRAKDGNKVICEKVGLVNDNQVCKRYIYSPLKRIPVKQLDIHGNDNNEDAVFTTSLADYDKAH
jgi:hypothetical protein